MSGKLTDLNPFLSILEHLTAITVEMAAHHDRDFAAALDLIDDLMVATIKLKEATQQEPLTLQDIVRPVPIQLKYQLGRYVWTLDGQIALSVEEVQ